MSNNFNKDLPVWKYFYGISAIPRVSGNEKAVIQYLKKELTPYATDINIDSFGNLVAHIPATKGYENRPIVILQAHVDMVMAKTKDSKHNFSKDPIIPLYKDDYLYAKDTNLGADNGSGVAICMAIATNKNNKHGPLEIIFTTEEETGMIGANNLDSKLTKGEYLINFDGGITNITMGCNGGMGIESSFDLEWSEPDENRFMDFKIDGLLGGHGAQVAKFNHLNAIKSMANFLYDLNGLIHFNLVDIQDSMDKGQVPYMCRATICTNQKHTDLIMSLIKKHLLNTNIMYPHEVNFGMNFTDYPKSGKVITKDKTNEILNFLVAVFDGQKTFNMKYQKTECSSSMSMLHIDKDKLHVRFGVRGMFDKQKEDLANSIKETIKAFHGTFKITNVSKGWPINTSYDEFGKEFHEFLINKFNKDIPMTFSSGGLEPSALINRIDTIKGAFSFGAWGPNPHTVNEKLQVSSVIQCINYIESFLEVFK